MQISTPPHFSLSLAVRDYECDLQGIVNNAVYQNYLEHARHEFLRAINCSFVDLHNQGVDLVVTRLEMDFRKSLRAQDNFRVELWCCYEGRVRVKFIQKILRNSDNQLCIEAVVYGAALGQGKVLSPQKVALELNAFIESHPINQPL